jgi:amino acid adenylation domain-containing protein
MNLNELLEALRAHHVELWIEGDLLRFRMPEQLLDKELLAELRRHKRELVEQLKEAQRASSSAASRLEPLSIGQQALYFLHALAPQSPAYNVAAAFRISSPVDVPIMRKCFQTLVSRHEALRTTFQIVDGNPRCRIHSHMELDFRQLFAAAWDTEQVHEAVRCEYLQPFALHDGPLMRVRLFTISPSEHIFLMTLHHIIFDAWSLWLLQDEFQLLYRKHLAGETPVLPSLTATYSDFVREQTELQHSERGEQLWQYWSERLKGDLVAPDLPHDFPRPDRPSMKGASHKFRIPAELAANLRALAKSLGATPFVVLLAIFKTLLFRYTGQIDLTVGTTTSGRTGGGLTRVVGYFVNTLAIRTQLSEADTFATWVAAVKQRMLEALEHQDYPFPLLVNRLNPRRDTGRLPICSIVFGLQKPQQFSQASRLVDAEAGQADWGGLEVRHYDLPQQEGQFDLTLEVFDTNEAFLGTLKYDTDLFRPETAARMAQHYLRLAESIVEDPHRALTDYELLPDAEQELIRSFAMPPAVAVPADARVHRLFEAQVARAPDRLAAADDDQILTYDALNRRANQLARFLGAHGVRPGSVVACHPGRGLPTAVSLLAVLKAGGTYVPLDPHCPHERRDVMLGDCGARIVLSHSRYRAHRGGCALREPAADQVETIYLDEVTGELADYDATDLPLDFPADTTAYVIYTSGSTGQPKGVCVSHRAITRHVLSIREVFGVVPKDRVLQFSQTTFDPSLEQMLVPWSIGASVWMRGDDLWSPAEFWQRVRSLELTVINVPPAYFRHCTDALVQAKGAADSLRLVIVGGDVFPVETLPVWQASGVRVVNAYGPTEALITATVHDVSHQPAPRARVPIGRPKPGMSAYVLDETGRFAPLGVPGELHLGGDMLADGYLHQPGLTQQFFVRDPWSTQPNARMYRTGDCVRWNMAGELEFLGRRDRQIKIHGYRVEIGEIEAVLVAHEAVKEAHVAARQDSAGDTFLIAWVGAAHPTGLTAEPLRDYLRDRLPGYMVPRQFVLVERLPLTSSGKVDARSLPEPSQERPAERVYVAPRTQLEQMLVDIWSRVLGVEHVGTHDNFFDLGGSSLSSLRIIALLNEAGLEVKGKRINPELLFEYPTVAQLAAFCEAESLVSGCMG